MANREQAVAKECDVYREEGGLVTEEVKEVWILCGEIIGTLSNTQAD